MTVVSDSAQSARLLSPNPELQLVSCEIVTLPPHTSSFSPTSLSLPPANQNCLSASFDAVAHRPMILHDRNQFTNTSIRIFWDISASPLLNCDEEYFSIPPYTYRVEYELRMLDGDAFEIVSFYSQYAPVPEARCAPHVHCTNSLTY